MTAVKDKIRYEASDHNTYYHVLSNTEIAPIIALGDVDRGAFEVAVLDAMYRVPLNDPPKGAFNRQQYVLTRLQEAIRIRDARYLQLRQKATLQ